MIHRVLKIGRWIVDFLFATKDYEPSEIQSLLLDMGASSQVLDEVYRIIDSGTLNTGFTYTSQKRKRALVVTGPTSSGREYLNTLTHEVRHLADAIAKSLDVELDSEPPAYMTGDTIMALAESVCELGCRCSID